MKTPSWTMIGLAVIVPLALATAACTKKPGTDETVGSTVPADPKQALVASVAELSKGNFRFTVKDAVSSASGAVHEPSKSAEVTINSAAGEDKMMMAVRCIGNDVWIKVDTSDPETAQVFGIPNKIWLHVNRNKIKDKSDYLVDFDDPNSIDMGESAKIVKAVASAKRTGEGSYSGTIDLTQLKDVDVVDGIEAKTAPFKATLDTQGRLTGLTIDVPAAGEDVARNIQLTYSDYGAAVAPKRPAASETKEAPASLYELISET